MTLAQLRRRFHRHHRPVHPDSVHFVIGAPLRIPLDFNIRLLDRCPNCAVRLHGRCTGGRCKCPSLRCHGLPWRALTAPRRQKGETRYDY